MLYWITLCSKPIEIHNSGSNKPSMPRKKTLNCCALIFLTIVCLAGFFSFFIFRIWMDASWHPKAIHSILSKLTENFLLSKCRFFRCLSAASTFRLSILLTKIEQFLCSFLTYRLVSKE